MSAQRNERLLTDNWRFTKGEVENAAAPTFDDSAWEKVCIPHDWAIYGPFSRDNDLQNVAVSQNFERQASVKTGRTGGLPYVGTGWYRTHFDADTAQLVTLVFDGAMSEARVFVNGQEVCFWPYGYNSFHCNITAALNTDGKDNVLAVRLENKPQSSRWYPGAGLYRNVRLVQTKKVHIPVWGTQLTTPHINKERASICLKTSIENAGGTELILITEIHDAEGKVVAHKENSGRISHGEPFVQNLSVKKPRLWSPESPHLYKAITRVYADGQLQDCYSTPFGIRHFEFVPEEGFYLNGEQRKFQGVCLHHDLGALGAAVNESSIRRQLLILKDMGCDAIRTAHNMPAPELVRLCDEMGFMLMIEAFDEWDVAKCANGYHRFFNDWAEKDLVNMLRQFRNNPSVILWSIGNEVPTQCAPQGYKVARFLRDICHREDPTRPVTCGMDQVGCVLQNGFAAVLDIPGFNYRAHRYREAYDRLPQNFVLGAETSSTVSSRGVYHFPVKRGADVTTPDHQSSSYDLEHCSWSNIPDIDFALADDYPWTLGQFVWTGFDYLGEPSPYDTDAWPNHSSLFGIVDLATIPKDRFYLYRSVWNYKAETLHLLPHWNWEGREGETTPVFVYTNHFSAELFVNGKSQGKRDKCEACAKSVEERYRLMWNDVKYEPGELRVVAYDYRGKPAAEKIIRTAGKPHHFEFDTIYNAPPVADGKSLYYITLRAVDKDGNFCPGYKGLVNVNVNGAASFRAVCNGDPTCLELFHLPRMHAFSGMLTVIAQLGNAPGTFTLEASAKGMKRSHIQVEVKDKR